ncbi:MAG: M24 family metallopeptidase, partial [Clostridia bacterium]|nr:M24 family metallopeptidase [Clostridia bacterium]
AVPTDRKIQDIDVITIDMGCRVNGYCSDMTRTIFVGEVPQYIKPVYELVLKNQEQVLNDMKETANTKLIAKMVDNEKFLSSFSHSKVTVAFSMSSFKRLSHSFMQSQKEYVKSPVWG